MTIYEARGRTPRLQRRYAVWAHRREHRRNVGRGTYHRTRWAAVLSGRLFAIAGYAVTVTDRGVR